MENKFPCPKCGSYDIEISYATISFQVWICPQQSTVLLSMIIPVISAEILDIVGSNLLNPIIE